MSAASTRPVKRSVSERRWVRWSAWGLAFAELALSCGALGLVALNHASGSLFPPDLESALLFPIVGALIVSKRPRNIIGWTLCVGGLLEAISTFGPQYLTYTARTQPGVWPLVPLMAWLGVIDWAPGFDLLLVFLPSLFPDGRFLSTRWRGVGWLAIVGAALWVLPVSLYVWRAISSGGGPQQLYELLNGPHPPATIQAILAFAFPLMGISVLLAGASLVLRLLRAQGVQRQQLKWFAYAGALVALATGLDVAQSVFLGSQYALVGGVLLGATFPLLVMAMGVAILRYRLWDIDILINRTLVYGLLTAILAAVYFARVYGAQALRALVPAQEVRQSPVLIVASTLLVASLFTPLRRRIQATVDRRFYGRKYDAANTLARFGAALRNEVDWGCLKAHLVNVVDGTMQSTHISLWLREPAIRVRTGAQTSPWQGGVG